MNQGKICVSVCGETADEVLTLIRAAEDVADVIEIRFDCLRPEEIQPLVEHLATVGKQLLITFRPIEQGGKRRLTVTERIEFWKFIQSRLKGMDFLIDYEFDIDLPLKLGSERTIVSTHDFEGPGKDLQEQLEALTQLTGKTIKIAVAVKDACEAIDVWKLLGKSSKPVIPIAMGEAGKWTRILALAHGAPMTYASLEEGVETAPGQISAKDLGDVYRAKELDDKTDVFGVVAGDTSYSLSPYMHNAAFKQTGLNSVFVPLQVSDLDRFMQRMVNAETREVELNFRGFSVTNPHKKAIMKYLDRVDETVQKIGAVNTVKVDKGKLLGYNTDAEGFVGPLKKMYGGLKGARVAVTGSGGAARACVYALQRERAIVTIFARDPKKARALEKEFGVVVKELTTDNQQLRTHDIIVNATPLGTKGEHEHETIATSDELRGVKLVYDLVYNPAETQLINEAKAVGVRTLSGIEMLIAQGARQFQIWTGSEAPIGQMRAAVEKRLK